MKIDLIPGALNAISNMASGSSSPGSANHTPTPPPGGGGGGGGGGGKGNGQGKGKGKGANKRNLDGSPKTDGPPSSPSGTPDFIAPGVLAKNCSWSAQVLTIKRESMDKKTKQFKQPPSGVFDVGKFCAATGNAFNDYCWEFVCSMWMSTFDRANKALFDTDANRQARALRVACARCPHTSDTSNHPEAVASKHKLPGQITKRMTYFRQR